jgi:tetratricopeptide (TPR) repeat protein
VKETPVPAELAAARLLVAEKRWEEALPATEAAIAADGTGVEPYLLRGRAYEGLDDFDSAEAALMEAFRRDRTCVEALYILAEMAERKGMRARCEELYRRVLEEVDPRFVPAREQLVRLYLNANQVAAARECLAGFAHFGQSGPAVERCRAYLDFRTNTGENRLAEYRAELERIARVYPSDGRTHVDLAILLFAAHEYETALEQVHAALALDAGDLRSRELLALVEAKRLRFDQAIATMRGLLRDRPRNAGYQQQVVELSLDAGDFDGAAAGLRELLARDDLRERGEGLTEQLVGALGRAERHEEAVAAAKQWLDQAPGDGVRRVLYMAALTEAQRHDETVRTAEAWLAEAEKDTAPRGDVGRGGAVLQSDAGQAVAALRLQVAQCLGLAGRNAEAQQRLLAWLAESPDDVDLSAELIRTCWLRKEYDEAIELASAGAEDADHEAAYEDLLGRSYLLAERFDEAIELYRRRFQSVEGLRRKIQLSNDAATVQFYAAAIQEAANELVSALMRARQYREAEDLVGGMLAEELPRGEAAGVRERSLAPAVPRGEAAAAGKGDRAREARLRRMLAQVYQETDRRTQALQQLETILKLTPNDPGINNDLGYILAEGGERLEDAERMIRFAAGEKPREYAYLDSLGWVLFKRGQFDEAIRYLELALKQGGKQDAVIWDHLGDALHAAGRAEPATEAWRKAVKLTEPDRVPAPDAEDRRVRERAARKLRQAEEEGNGKEGTRR